MNAANGPQITLGTINVFFCFVNGDDSWIPAQTRAASDAVELLLNTNAEQYRRSVFGVISEIMFCNTGTDKYEIREHRVFLKYLPQYTDNYIYLASRLIEIAMLMDTQGGGLPKEARNQIAREKQLAFLSLYPEAYQVRKWLVDHKC